MAGCKMTSAPNPSSCARSESACSAGRVTTIRLPNKGRARNQSASGSAADTRPTMAITGGRSFCSRMTLATSPSLVCVTV